MEKQNLKANLDERLDERRTGKPNDKEYPDWYTRQFQDENFKTEGGESQKDVRERMESVFNEIVERNKGKRKKSRQTFKRRRKSKKAKSKKQN